MSKNKKVRKALRITGIVLASIILLLAIGRFTAQRIIYHKATTKNAISQIVTVNLGGYDQKVLIEGKTEDLPILICLHGGPELPAFFGGGYRGAYPKLTENYILVQWDQYGCGLNYAEDLEKLGIEDFKNMVCDLVKNMKKKYPGHDIYLFGQSWGSVLSMEAASELKNDIAGIINVAPFQNLRAAKEVQYNRLKNSKLSDKKMAVIEKCMKGDDIESYLPVEAMVDSEGLLIYSSKNAGGSYLNNSLLRLLISPDYSLKDILHAFYMEKPSNQKSIHKLLVELYEIDETENIKQVEVPLLILRGEHDVYGFAEFFKSLPKVNANITYVEVPECGHIPRMKGFNRIQEELIKFQK